MTTEAPRAAGPTRSPAYLRTALSARMLAMLVLLLVAAAVCARLGVWQLDRASLRGAANAEVRAEEMAAAAPVPLAEVLEPQSSVVGDRIGTRVAATGSFGQDELLVSGRVLDGRTGYLVLTPMDVDGAVLPVVRGWVADVGAAQDLAPAPTGEVTITGYLQAGEAGGSAGLPAGQVDAVSSAELVNRWGGPIYGGYVVLTTVDPPQDAGLAVMPAPSPVESGLNVQNLAYALQWWIFGAFGLVLWLRMVRDEARAEVEEDADAGAAAPVSRGTTTTDAGASP